MEEPIEFKAKMIDGKPVIQAKCERIPNKNGGYDVVVHAPSLQLINEFKELNKE